jgi:glutathione-regulated potassium-efflux system protein KefB
LGLPQREVRFLLETFKAHDRRRLYEDYRHYTDLEKLQARARTSAQELEDLFAQDATEHAKAEQEQKLS